MKIMIENRQQTYQLPEPTMHTFVLSAISRNEEWTKKIDEKFYTLSILSDADTHVKCERRAKRERERKNEKLFYFSV